MNKKTAIRGLTHKIRLKWVDMLKMVQYYKNMKSMEINIILFWQSVS